MRRWLGAACAEEIADYLDPDGVLSALVVILVHHDFVEAIPGTGDVLPAVA